MLRRFFPFKLNKEQQSINNFVKAAYNNDITKVTRMLEETPLIINQEDEYGDTALVEASSNGHTGMVQLLLEKGADSLIKNKSGWTALMKASSNGHSAVVQLLLEKGADVNAKNEWGYTALMDACRGGHLTTVQILLQHGADVRVKNKKGKTPFDLTQNEFIRRLIHGASEVSTHIDMQTEDNSIAALNVPSILAASFHVIRSSDVAVIDRISSTVFSCVYRSKYRGTDVAIKMLRGDGAMSPAEVHLKEIEILSNLRHPRIVSLLGVVLDLEDKYESMAGVVTEFMPRGSLYDVLHLNTTPPEHRLSTLSSKLRVLRDVADGMRFLHMSNVIHRDLKSPNVLLDEDGRAKICDFGMSKLLSTNATHATTGGVGTPAWQAPEFLLMESSLVRISCDVYSFGVILWEMLTNSIPWNGVHPFQIAARVSHGESLSLAAAAYNCQSFPELLSMLEKCLSHIPDDRPTFEDILQCLSQLLPACMQREGHVSCPNEYMCPISYDIMEDPVICSDGHSYERGAIQRWLQHHDTSPKTNMILKDKTLRPNIALKILISEFKEANHRQNGGTNVYA